MKIILSRKGFDTSNGGIPSPILPDGILLSLPIPSDDDTLTFDDLRHGEHTYIDILRQLAPERSYKNKNCHLDPDIREGARIQSVSDWKPAFGQTGSAQGVLRNRNVAVGDLFLFFGRYQKTVGSIAEGTLRFNKEKPIIHIIYGYMEIGKIVTNDKIPEMNFHWHPHGFGERLLEKNNTLYIPSETLSFNSSFKGWGTFNYAESRILTLADKTATWREIPALMPGNLLNSKRKNSAKGAGIYYGGVWQEMVIKAGNETNEWINEIF